jgi:hypothetical protein
MTWSLIDIGDGYHRGALNLTSYHSQSFHPVFSTYRPLISSPSLKLGAYQHYNQSLCNKKYSPEISRVEPAT